MADSAAVALIRDFYDRRRAGDPQALRPFLADDVVWREPDVGDHMGELIGADAVIDMIERALATTGNSFALTIAEAVGTATACAVLIDWQAHRGGRLIEGRELAVYQIRDGCIARAQFFPENITDDQAFWS